MLSGARDAGAVMSVLYALPRLVFTQVVTGQWPAASSSASEALTLSISSGQRPMAAIPLAWLTVLAALRDRPDYEALLTQAQDVVAGQPLGVLTNPAHDLLRYAMGRALPTTATSTQPSTTSAGSRCRPSHASRPSTASTPQCESTTVRATAWVEQSASFADGIGWPWALAAVEHGRALLAEPAAAPGHFDRALAHHTSGGRPYDRARTHLAYGELLRGSQRRIDARTHLRSALEIFEDLWATPLITRATQELRASGETARRRDPSTSVGLTPMERQVAQLVSKGMSNKEVAAQCWISHRTVAFHLRNCFTKTGVTSRGELAQLDLA
jgi:DNA-binding CsgD family transcriptional regulator